MFGADAVHLQATLPERHTRDLYPSDSFDYLLPSLTLQPPWSPKRAGQTQSMDDFILIAEFSEQEGPRPVICIPKDGGDWFDKNDFSVKILSVDYQSSVTDNITEDAQVVMSDAENSAYAFVHHLVLNDIQARGYVRPFCIAYVTADSSKIMKIYAELSKQLKLATRQMKYGNRLVFMRDLEKHLEDLSYTKAHLLISQSRTQGTSQSDNDLLTALNNIRQSMEEVTEILSNLQPLLNDKELQEKFEQFEAQSRVQRRRTESGSGSLNECDSRTGDQEKIELSGSFTERHTPEYSLFMKSKDLKPKLIDVSALRGKRRFDRSLRGLHSLCSWGAKEGLQRLRFIQEFLKRDRCNIQLDEIDEAIISPDSGVLSFGHSSIGANFLSPHHWLSTCCQARGRYMHPSHGQMSSFCSVESFQSLPGSFDSFLDDETMYSATSSIVGTSLPSRQISLNTTDRSLSINSHYDVNFYCDVEDKVSLAEDSLVETLTTQELDDRKPRSQSSNSDFVDIDKDLDLKCSVEHCPCSPRQNMPEHIGAKSVSIDATSKYISAATSQGTPLEPTSKGTCSHDVNVKTEMCNKRPAEEEQLMDQIVADTEGCPGEEAGITDVSDEGDPILLASPSSEDKTDTSQSDAEKVSRNLQTDSLTSSPDDEADIEDDGVETCEMSAEVRNTGTEVVFEPGEVQGHFKAKTGGHILDSDALPTNEARFAASRRRRILHLHGDNSDATLGSCMLRVLSSYNHLQHLVYSILSGRPVVVIATRRHEAAVHDLINALSIFIPVVHSSSPATVTECVQLKLPDIPKFGVRGMIRDERKSVDYLVSASVRRYITLLDLDKMVLYCQPYQGSMLHFIQAIYDRKKSLVADQSIVPYIQMKLQEISLQAFNFYHCMSGGETDLDYSGVHAPRKSAMLGLSSRKYFNENGIHNSDCRIIKHLVEVVKLQQIEEEYQSRYLTDSPVLPLCLSHQPTVLYKLS